LSKRELRLIAVDDGAFGRRHRWAPVAAVAVIAPERLVALAIGRARVDGRDANERIAALVRATGQLDGTKAVLLDGISIAGFNLVDLEALADELERPVVAVTPRPPELPAIRAALATYFPTELAERWGIVRKARPTRVALPGGPLYAAIAGAPRSVLPSLLARVQARGRWPEPLALAHRIARAAARPIA
jgi:uncharacterized protein